MGFTRGKRWGLHPSAAGKTHCGSGSNAQHCAIDEFRESWGEDMARDLEWFRVDTNWHTTSNTNFHHENNGVIIGYHWQQHFWNICKIAYIPIIFQALCGPWILDGSTALRDNDFPNFPLRLGIPRETRVHLPCPREMLRAPGAGGKCFQPQHVSFGCETWW